MAPLGALQNYLA